MREAPLIPEEAVQAACDAVARMLFTDQPEYGALAEDDEDLVRAAVEAAAPVLAAHARAQALWDAAAGRVTLEEWATVQGVTVPQRIEDLQTKEHFTAEEVEAFFAVLDEPSCCDQVRRETAEQIAQAITDRRCDQGSTFCKDCMCRREDGALARQIGDAQ